MNTQRRIENEVHKDGEGLPTFMVNDIMMEAL